MQTKGYAVAAALLAWAQCLQLAAAQLSTPTAEQDRNANRTLSIGYVIYDGFTILDVYGPLEFIAVPFKINFTMIAKTSGITHTRPPPTMTARRHGLHHGHVAHDRHPNRSHPLPHYRSATRRARHSERHRRSQPP
ncbi:hypothetical protein MFIFM68171_07298 [Madurella fahalii]|uniref:Uncharacterized protein n=1 Tax=Madurella fahalii TaxID=1157608 RepID=A0ABQ0GH52_9PEZI